MLSFNWQLALCTNYSSGIWPGPIVTEVVPASDFWDAEEEHQAYLQKHPNGYTCHYIRPDWKLPQLNKA